MVGRRKRKLFLLINLKCCFAFSPLPVVPFDPLFLKKLFNLIILRYATTSNWARGGQCMLKGREWLGRDNERLVRRKFKTRVKLFPNFTRHHLITHTNFTRENKIEEMYEKPRVNVKVERGSTFAFTRDLPYIASILFTRVKFAYVKITQQCKSTLKDSNVSGNQ